MRAATTRSARARFKAIQASGERTFDMEVALKIGAEEQVQTAAGSVTAVKITREARWKQRNSDNAGVNTWTYWYSAAAKRFVLAEQTNVTAAGKELIRERQELVTYSVK
jgi:hypothetical protein